MTVVVDELTEELTFSKDEQELYDQVMKEEENEPSIEGKFGN